MMTTAEAAERIGIKPRSVWQLIRRGQLAAEKRGRDYWIEESEVERYISERRPAHRPARKERTMNAQITGSVTLIRLDRWMEANRPDLATYDDQGTKGFYKKNIGPAHSFQSCGPTWRDVAVQIGAVDVADQHERNTP